ncbi:MAG: DUF3987 domain-containing protein, partial [Deltaproteobacteria bacterium]
MTMQHESPLAVDTREAARMLGISPQHVWSLTGRRNNTLASLASTMRRRGMPAEAIEAALLQENALRCDPPLPDDEVRRIARSVARYEPSADRAAPAWQAFPPDALPKQIRRFVTAGAEAIGCDPAYLAVSSLVACAFAIGRSRCLRLKTRWREYPVLWAALVGESGTQKSPAMDLALGPLRKRQEEAFAEYEKQRKTYEEEVRQAKREKSRRSRGSASRPAEPRPPVCTRYLVSDTTCEALAPILVDNPRGLLLARDELAGWIRSQNEYKRHRGSDTANWLSTWQGGSWMIDRKGAGPLHIPEACVSILGGIQPEVLRAALGREHMHDGMAARLLLAYPPPRTRQWTEEDIPSSVLDEMDDLIGRLLALQPNEGGNGPEPVELTLSPEAKAAWREFYNRHNLLIADAHEPLRSALSKLEAYGARFALVLALCRDAAATEVAAPDVEAAARLVDWFADEARRVYAAIFPAGDGDAVAGKQAKLVDFIKRRGGAVTLRDVYTGCRWLDPQTAESALRELVAAG